MLMVVRRDGHHGDGQGYATLAMATVRRVAAALMWKNKSTRETERKKYMLRTWVYF
jgi:hypothetical protein